MRTQRNEVHVDERAGEGVAEAFFIHRRCGSSAGHVATCEEERVRVLVSKPPALDELRRVACCGLLRRWIRVDHGREAPDTGQEERLQPAVACPQAAEPHRPSERSECV